MAAPLRDSPLEPNAPPNYVKPCKYYVCQVSFIMMADIYQLQQLPDNKQRPDPLEIRKNL